MSEPTLILGLESSCDETSCAVVADGHKVLSNVVATQIELHTRYGGVVPEIASRAHIEAINSVIAQALEQSGVRPADIRAVAVTHEPGLIGSLLVGLMAAKTLAWVWEVPLLGINHIYAHAYAAALDSDPLEYPAVALICSGGHTALYRCNSPTEMELLGTTIDDAAGEAFDKVASILKLGYPGGPVIDKVAKSGNPAAVDFPRTLLDGQSLDFSFSGLKTAVLYHVNGVPQRPRRAARGSQGVLPDARPPAAPRDAAALTPQQTADIAASFQAAVIDVLKTKMRRAVMRTGAKTIVIGGGVSANSALRAAAAELAGKLHCKLRLPALQYCVDNAAMIAGLGYHYYRLGRTSELDLEAQATVRR
jgi:N6-L-threonylcarbamoyladenine synthase